MEAILAGLGVAAGAVVVEAWNKADRLTATQRAEAESAIARNDHRAVLVSAATGEGLEALLRHIDAQLGRADEVLTLEISPREGRLLSWLHTNAEVLAEEAADTGTVTARFRIDPANRGKLESQLRRIGR